jgi:hypothetical protein
MKVRFCLLTLAALLFFSCKKKKAEPEEEAPASAATTYPQFMPFKTGNYWIYERFRVEKNGSSSSLNNFDSVYVEKDTVIQGSSWWKIRRFDYIYSQHQVLFLKDSLHYIVQQNASPGPRVKFSSEDFQTIWYDNYQIVEDQANQVNDTICHIRTKMDEKDLSVTTKAGAFFTSDMKIEYLMFPKYTPPGISSSRYMHNRFAKSVGLVIESEPFFVTADYQTERRLIRYHLN